MRMTWTSFMQFLFKSWQEQNEAFVIVAEMKRGATETIRKWCHGSVPVPVTWLRYRCKREVCGSVQKMVGHSGIPGVPWVDDGDNAKEGQCAPTIRARSKHEHLIHHACIHSRAVVSGLYLRSVCCRNGTSSMRCRGSRRSRDVRSGSSRSLML